MYPKDPLKGPSGHKMAFSAHNTCSQNGDTSIEMEEYLFVPAALWESHNKLTVTRVGDALHRASHSFDKLRNHAV